MTQQIEDIISFIMKEEKLTREEAKEVLIEVIKRLDGKK